MGDKLLFTRADIDFLVQYMAKHPKADAVWITSEDMQIWTKMWAEARYGWDFKDKTTFPVDWSLF